MRRGQSHSLSVDRIEATPNQAVLGPPSSIFDSMAAALQPPNSLSRYLSRWTHILTPLKLSLLKQVRFGKKSFKLTASRPRHLARSSGLTFAFHLVCRQSQGPHSVVADGSAALSSRVEAERASLIVMIITTTTTMRQGSGCWSLKPAVKVGVSLPNMQAQMKRFNSFSLESSLGKSCLKKYAGLFRWS